MPEIIKTALQDLLAAYLDMQLSNSIVRLSIIGNATCYVINLADLRQGGAVYMTDVWHKSDNLDDAAVIAMRLSDISYIKSKIIQFGKAYE